MWNTIKTLADINIGGQVGNVGGNGNLMTVVLSVLKYVFGIIGLIAVIMIIIGGIKYVTSQGDPSRTKSAKDTILYSVIGLIIALAAFAIVSFILDSLTRAV